MTGGARIGRDVARALAERGCHLALSYRRSKRVALQVAEEAGREGVSTLLMQGDMAAERDVKRCVSKIKRKFGRLDVLINMASDFKRIPLRNLNAKTWTDILGSNLTSAFLTSLHAVPLLKKSRGRIINFSDAVAERRRPHNTGYVPYYTAKVGVLGLTEALALELAPEILVNAIAPGPIMPPVGSSSRHHGKVLRQTLLNRWGGGEEVAKAVLYLLESDFVTGECLRIDGGSHLI